MAALTALKQQPEQEEAQIEQMTPKENPEKMLKHLLLEGFEEDEIKKQFHEAFKWPESAIKYAIKAEKKLIEKEKKLAEKDRALVNLVLLTNFIEQKAGFDELTGVPNVRKFHEIMYRDIAEANRSGEAISLLMFDLDHFKRFNDKYGHGIGDDVLKATAKVLSKTGISRESDFLARYGGEEFIAILPSTSEEGAGIVAEKCRKVIEEEATKQIQKIAEKLKESAKTEKEKELAVRLKNETVTVSIGIRSYPKKTLSPGEKRGIDPKTFKKQADIALYHAKHGNPAEGNKGRNQFITYTEGMTMPG